MVRPKKNLGQHFLTDPGIAERIVNLLPENKDLKVVEIGPGTGILTGLILEKQYREFIPVEIDRESVQHLKMKYPHLDRKIVEGDFLKLGEDLFQGEGLHLIGNFPYNISSQIFFKVLDQRAHIQSVVCMLQKEVADRITASPGSKTYGILSVLLQAYYTPKFRFSVKPGSFFPPPKVTSGVITLERNSVDHLPCDEKLFFRIVKTTFNQRRKTIRNSLKTILLTLGDENEILSGRPEQLGVSEFIALTNFVASKLRQTDSPDHEA